MDNTVWIATIGGVIGVNLSWLNEKIDYFNSNSYLRSNADFLGVVIMGGRGVL